MDGFSRLGGANFQMRIDSAADFFVLPIARRTPQCMPSNSVAFALAIF